MAEGDWRAERIARLDGKTKELIAELDRCRSKLTATLGGDPCGCVEGGEANRATLDLTRALARWRKTRYTHT